MRKQVNYNKIVGIAGGAVYVLEYIFEDGSFKGATGYSMRPVYQDYIDNMNEPDTVRDEIEHIWRDAVAHGDETRGLEEYAEWCIDAVKGEGRLHIFDDDSFRDDFKQILDNSNEETRQAVEQVGGDCVAWECESCGRCLKVDFEQVLDKDAVDAIQKVEQ